jgi:hypothetical protein
MRLKGLRYCVTGALLVLSMVPSAHAAGCIDMLERGDSMPDNWVQKVAKSSDQGLASAYANGLCTYWKGPHGGGTVPGVAANGTHITVKYGGTPKDDVYPDYTCHVFDPNKSVWQKDSFPTTCVKN